MSQISYIPYLPLKENQKIDFGNGLVVWHYDSFANQYIKDSSTKDFVTKLLEANVQGENQEKIKGISVISIGNTDFREFNLDEQQMVQEAKLLLFLCKIAKSNTTILGSGSDGWSLSTSENFQPVYQNFQIGNDHISESTGYIVNVGIGGYKVNEKKFNKPNHVMISPYGMTFDNELFTQLLKKSKRGKKLYRRILKATDLLFQAYYNNANVSRNARILLIAAAFEMLLDIPERQGRKHFKNLIEKYCDIPNEPKYRHYYYDRGRAKRDKDRSIKVLWADSFFQLRNQIIHGDLVPEDSYLFKNGNRHLDIAILFFVLLVKALLNSGASPKPFLDKIEWKKREDNTTGFHYEDRSVSVALSRIISREYKKAEKKAKKK